ncbi:hypothetical protein DNTS_035691 [Danionella cerebrum]|uniref:Uncharacterized protein n=1 Tax=Danionella cerebrum TaxID=2873325 RepID=A0A553QQX8_9TELE|nr:hypothetical protein DNTS_035691 [Danionella translucida]
MHCEGERADCGFLLPAGGEWLMHLTVIWGQHKKVPADLIRSGILQAVRQVCEPAVTLLKNAYLSLVHMIFAGSFKGVRSRQRGGRGYQTLSNRDFESKNPEARERLGTTLTH